MVYSFRPMASGLTACLLMVSLTGCARDLSSDTYKESAVAGKVLEGTVLSARPVKIKAADKVSDNGVGILAGGAGGAVAGSAIGNGSGNAAATVGGAIAGAVLGAFIQDAMSTSEGTEYLVKLDPKYIERHIKTKKEYRMKGYDANEDIASSMETGTATDILSVVQKSDPAITTGAHVYIVYHDDRPRLVAQPPATK